MRKSIIMVGLLLTAFLITGCTRQPDLTGCWETSTDETLCATVLYLNGDHSFIHHQEGQSLVGTWGLHGDTLTLSSDSGNFTYALDRENGRLDMGDNLHLYRQPDPDIVGYWYNFSDGSPVFSSLLLMDSGLFCQEDSIFDFSSPSFDSGKRTTGNWSLSGLVLTLRGNDGTLLTYRLNPDCTTIDMGNGVLLKKHIEN